MSPLAMDPLPWIGAVCVLLVVALLVVLVAPWRDRDAEALDPEVEARLLLGEDPEEIERDLEQGADPAAPVAELRRDE